MPESASSDVGCREHREQTSTCQQEGPWGDGAAASQRRRGAVRDSVRSGTPGGGGTANTEFSDDPKNVFNVTEQKSAELQRPWPPFEINWGTVHVKM